MVGEAAVLGFAQGDHGVNSFERAQTVGPEAAPEPGAHLMASFKPFE
jgi:hypothetical protein